MKSYYDQNYKRAQIAVVLQEIKACIGDHRYIISKNQNRQENIAFRNEYNLSSKRHEEILLAIEVDDFCHTLKNTKAGFEHEVLYVFCPQVALFTFASNEGETVDVYTKFNLINSGEDRRVVVISFHKRNKPIAYAFKV